MLTVIVDLGGAQFEEVFALYRRYSGTLGAMPRGAFEDFARKGRLIAAIVGDRVVGYIAYRLSRGDAAIAHVCVAREHRGLGVIRELMARLLFEVPDVAALRLTCRRDYPATRLWPVLHFVQQGPDRPGRGGALVTWSRDVNPQPSLMALLQAAQFGSRRVVAMDANVFFDLGEDTTAAEESKALLADWLEEEIVLCVTAELANEIGQAASPERRERSRIRAMEFQTLRGDPLRCEEVRLGLDGILPAASTRQDRGDRRQLAHAVAEDAWAFVTRDEALLARAETIEALFGILVLRPVDLLLTLQNENNGSEYEPARLAGTRILISPLRADEREDVEARFHRTDRGESRSAWQARFRGSVAGTRCEVITVSRATEAPLLVYGLDRAQDGLLLLPLLRAANGGLVATLLRRILAEAVTTAHAEQRHVVRCTDAGTPAVDLALHEVGFSRVGDHWERHTLRGLVQFEDLPAVTRHLPEPAREFVVGTPRSGTAQIERRFWPLKVIGAGVETFVIPIQPHWAEALFDAGLAGLGLFGPPPQLALALENTYYSGSRNTIPAGSRILWYVSKDKDRVVREIRATSICEETCKGSASTLFRRFRRLGIFRWSDVLRTADGKPEETTTAYRFSHTERFTTPVPWGEFQDLHRYHAGRGNQVQGPTRISEAVFADVYRRGMSIA